VVTTNADSGAGSLREAIGLAAANGDVSPDLIVFNIPDLTEAGRTITVQSQLPNLSSNLVIDGSTQPGLNLGVSGAKVKIQHSGSIEFSKCFILSHVEKIEIYGIYFFDFRYSDPNAYQITCAIFITEGVKNIKIGAVGRGNVFLENGLAIADNYPASTPDAAEEFSDVEIKANFFGLKEDGETMSTNRNPAIALRTFKNLLIGGDTEAEGNCFIGGFNGGTDAVISLNAYKDIGNGYVKLKNNTFGTNFSRTKPLRCGTVTIQGQHDYYNNFFSDVILTVSKNIFNNNTEGFSSNCNGMLSISNLSGYVTITGNKIGNLMGWISCQTYGIAVSNCKNGIIGGDTPDEQNIVATNYYVGASVTNCEHFIIRKNSFYCNAKGIIATSTKVEIPWVKMLKTDAISAVAGLATPNCKIEVFENNRNCSVCNNGETYIGETRSDHDGNWGFGVSYLRAVTARATTADSISGEFSEAFFDASHVITELPTCNGNNGSITGMGFISGTRFYWVKYHGGLTDTFFNQVDIANLGPALYEFHVEQTRYCDKKYTVNLYDQSPVINTQYQVIQQPSCSLANGAISNINANGRFTKVYWLSSTRDTVSNNLELKNAGEGSYKLFIVNTEFGCADSSSWIPLVNQGGPSLVINSAKINFAKCGNSNGSITGIAVNNATGTQSIQWIDSLNNIIGNGFNLLNVKAGKYRLRFKDQSTCDTIITSFFEVKDTTVIIINIAGRIVKPAGCGSSNGSISNVIATNASNFTWKNMNGFATVGNTLNISGLASGFYQLTAGNAFGCSDNSNGIYVANTTFDAITVTDYKVTKAGCNNAQGKIDITGFNKPSSGYSFRWIDSASNLQLATGNTISGLGKGNYLLLAKDSNGCEQKIFSEFVDSLPTPFLSFAGMVVTNDICSGKVGGITGLTIKDLTGPTTYKWTDVNNIVSFGNQLTLSNMGAGEYKLLVNDAGCGIATSLITIGNDLNAGTAPQYKDVIVSKNSAATLTVTNFERGTYILFADAAGQQEVQRNTTGIFITAPIAANTSFYVKHIAGTCSSKLVEINVSTVDNSYFTIPKAFTPNGDLLNNLLTVRIVGFIKLEHFRIFNRYGQVVFETSQINDKWNGKYKGKDLPDGAYIWIAEGMDITGKIIRDKGTVMILR
jgi:gliding motility-associated-like protein